MVDTVTREALAIEVDTSLPGERVVRVLDRLATRTRLDAAQLARELGPLIIPGPPPSEQPPAR